MKSLSVVVLTLALMSSAFALPNAPTPQASDSWTFHRELDGLFGLTISQPVGMISNRPWLGLVAGIGAGVADEARYGQNFNSGHLAVISGGAFAGYAINKVIQHYDRKHQRRIAAVTF